MAEVSSLAGSRSSDENGGSVSANNEKSSSMDASTQGESSNNNSSASPFVLAQKETRLVTWSKMVVLSIILMATVLAAVVTYKYTTKQEESMFENQFQDYAAQIAAISKSNAIHIFDIYDSFSRDIEAFAAGTNASWPFVTIPRFRALVVAAMQQSDSDKMVALHPLVSESQRSQWESYSVANQGWIKAELDYSGYDGPAPKICPYIKHGRDADCIRENEPPEPYYTPVWQVSPVLHYHDWINYNTMEWDYFNRTFHRMLDANSAVLSEVTNLHTNDTRWPESFMVQPAHNDTQENATHVVAVLSAVLPWHNYFTHLLPPGHSGIYIVVSNTCDQEFTYNVDGPNITYVGIGDLHETNYDYLETATPFDTWTNTKQCMYTVHLYPSDEFRQQYISHNPLIYTSAVVAIFLLTALVFIVYDCLVEMRQVKVMTTAENTNTIVR